MTAMSEQAPQIRHDKQLTHFCCSEDCVWPAVWDVTWQIHDLVKFCHSACLAQKNTILTTQSPLVSMFDMMLQSCLFYKIMTDTHRQDMAHIWACTATYTNTHTFFFLFFFLTLVHGSIWAILGELQCCHGNRASNLAQKAVGVCAVWHNSLLYLHCQSQET